MSCDDMINLCTAQGKGWVRTRAQGLGFDPNTEEIPAADTPNPSTHEGRGKLIQGSP